jgi:hypothetical protein
LSYRGRKAVKDAVVVERMKELSAQYPRYGYRRISAVTARLLRRDDGVIAANFGERAMGLETTAAHSLCAAKSLGADFTRVATIGRQWLLLSPSELNAVMRAAGVTSDIGPLLAEQFSEPFFVMMGAQEVESIDYSKYEGATHIHDMNVPIPPNLAGRYSLVFDGGSLEHVFNAAQAFKNCMEMVRVGGHFVQVSPCNNFLGHGFWQFSPELMFRVFAPENGYKIIAVLVQEITRKGRGPWYLCRDPRDVGWRVEPRIRLPTFVATIAKRIMETTIFETAPQQSDYQAHWTAKIVPSPNQTGPLPNRPFKRVAELVRQFIPEHIEQLIRSPYNPKSFTRLSGQDVLRGRFPAMQRPTLQSSIQH